MIIIGADFHPEFQQIALVDTGTGEFQEKRLGHPEEAEKFYHALAEWRAPRSARTSSPKKVIDTADVVREAMFRQQ